MVIRHIYVDISFKPVFPIQGAAHGFRKNSRIESDYFPEQRRPKDLSNEYAVCFL